MRMLQTAAKGNRRPTRKQVDDALERVVLRLMDGVQIDVFDMRHISDAARSAFEAGGGSLDTIESAVTEAIAKYRTN